MIFNVDKTKSCLYCETELTGRKLKYCDDACRMNYQRHGKLSETEASEYDSILELLEYFFGPRETLYEGTGVCAESDFVKELAYITAEIAAMKRAGPQLKLACVNKIEALHDMYCRAVRRTEADGQLAELDWTDDWLGMKELMAD